MKNTILELNTHCQAFDDRCVGLYRVRVNRDGVVSVLDDVTGQYTTNHSIGAEDIIRLQKMLKWGKSKHLEISKN